MDRSDRQDRRYLETHPFITFSTRLDTATPLFWMLLGEAKSKCNHMTRVPVKQDIGQLLHRIYFAKGVNATTAIEGNTLSEDEVRRRIDGDLDLPKSRSTWAPRSTTCSTRTTT